MLSSFPLLAPNAKPILPPPQPVISDFLGRLPSVNRAETAIKSASTEVSQKEALAQAETERRLRTRVNHTTRKRTLKPKAHLSPFEIGERQKKTFEQKKVIYKMFANHEGPITTLQRRRAEEATGIKWQKIYKFMFDLGQRFKCRPHLKSVNKMPQSSFRGKKIFKITKVTRR